MQAGLLRNADLAADKPLGFRAEFNRRAVADRTWNVDRNRQQDFIIIAVIDQFFARLQTLGVRPLDFASSKAGRQMPLKSRWLAGIPGIGPVNVPDRKT